jgi:hypothetical protein
MTTMPSRGVPGEGHDPYAERRARIPLVEALSRAFPDNGTITSICARSGLQEEIRTDERPVGTWTAVLAHAVDQNRIGTLLNEVLNTSRNPDLVTAAQHYLAVRES